MCAEDGKLCAGICAVICLLPFLCLMGIFFVYQVIESGELILSNAPGIVSILRESDTKILHIRGENMESIYYGQGFACA